MFSNSGPNNSSGGADRPVSWAFSDDILDRNIDQLDRETPRCNLSEEEEEELERSKLAMEAQSKSHGHLAPNPGGPNAWRPPNRMPQSSSTQPVSSYQTQEMKCPNSPPSNRNTIEAQGQANNKDNSNVHVHSSHSSGALPTTSGVPTSSINHPANLNGITSSNNRVGFASPTSSQTSHQTSNKELVRSPRAHCISPQSTLSTSSHHSANQGKSPVAKIPVSMARSLPGTPAIGTPTMHQQNKPLGMVTPQTLSKGTHPQIPKQAVSPQVSTPIQFVQPSSKTSSAQGSPKEKRKVSGQPTKSNTSQTAKVVPQKQPYRPLANCTNDQLKRMHGHAEAVCRVPNCIGCKEVRMIKDDPMKKAQLIRQVEDEILLRSRELDSCWQEDELDCVRDFTDMDRRKEMSYAETSEEGILKRVSDEMIKRPPPWHDDEVDSVKDFSERKRHEGEVSKVGSEEKVCLSPPWNEEEEELLARESGVTMVHQIKPMTSSMQVSDSAVSIAASSGCVTTTTEQVPFYAKYNCYNEIDSVKDYTSTYNNGQELGSRIPSSERISLTPPWTPSGCQTPAEGVPLLDKAPSQEPKSEPNNKETASVSGTSTAVSKIDTSGVQLRNKSRNSNRTAHCAPYVVPRFDDLEEDSVKDYSVPSRQLQELSSKMPSYEYLPFTPPWVSHNNSGLQTPSNGLAEIHPSPASDPSNTTSLAVTASLSKPTMSSRSSAVNEANTVPPVLSNFRNDRMYYDTYGGENNTGADSVRNFSMGLMEETSRIPSSEQLCFTPPWLEENDEAAAMENPNSEQSRPELTLEEQRAIEEEARKTGAEEAEAKAHEQRKTQNEASTENSGQPGATAGPPGRDSGFCSEQDQKQKQLEQQKENGIIIEEEPKTDNYKDQPQFQAEQPQFPPDQSQFKTEQPQFQQNQPQYQTEQPQFQPDQPQFQAEHQQCITSTNKGKDDVNASPERCWSSKESSGSNQTDISTVVNPATSVPITAPASPDPNGSEATNTDVSDNEASNAASNGGAKSDAAQQKDQQYNVSRMEDQNPHPYGYHSKQYYQHPSPQAAQNQPPHHTFPRTSMNAQRYCEAFGGPRYQMADRGNQYPPNMARGFGSDSERPRLQVPPYMGQYQPRAQMTRAKQEVIPKQNLYYQSMRQHVQRHPSHPQPAPHPQMHPQNPQMEYQQQQQCGQRSSIPQGQRMLDVNMKDPPRIYASQVRGSEQQQQPSGAPQPGFVGRQAQMGLMYSKNVATPEEKFNNVHYLLRVAKEQSQSQEKPPSQLPGPVRSVSQTNVQQQQSEQQQQNNDNASVVSFSSMAASHQNLDTKVDMVSSLLSMLGTHDKDDIARTLLAMSSSTDSCSAMRQSGCLPLLIKLLHDPAYETQGINWEARNRAGLALHNIINSGTGDRKGRREVRVLRLIEIVRAHSEAVLSGNMEKYQAHRSAPALREHGPGPAVAALMKLSFEEEHKNTISELGGLQVIAELLKVDFKLNGHCKDPYSITLRKYAGMALINLTYSDSKNKNTLLGMQGALRGIVTALAAVEEEDLVQVSAAIIRNVSWRTDDVGKRVLAEIGAARNLMLSCQNVRSEAAIRSVLSAVWNLSAHSSENKEDICSTSGSLQFLCYALNYRSPTRSLAIPENAGGIIRNISSHIAVKSEYRQILREHGCLKVLISQLRSPSTRIVSNSCGILWNLSARCIEDQELLWELGAVSMLKTLVNSKHKSISLSSASALRNLMAVKPGSSSTDTESHASFQFKRSNTLPGKSRGLNSQNNLRADRKYKSFFGKKNKEVNQNTQNSPGAANSKKPPLQRNTDDIRKVHRKVKQGEPHFYADLYQDPPRRGMSMLQTKDPTSILFHNENQQQPMEASNEGIAPKFAGSHAERWTNTQQPCNCNHGVVYRSGAPMNTLQQGFQDMSLREESPIIARQRKDSSSSSSSFSPTMQTHLNAPRVDNENSPLPVFRERKRHGLNPALNGHRRSMSDTISECGHPMPSQQPLHAVTDSELGKRDLMDFNSATYRKDEHASWHDLIQPSATREANQAAKNTRRELFELQSMKNERGDRSDQNSRMERGEQHIRGEFPNAYVERNEQYLHGEHQFTNSRNDQSQQYIRKDRSDNQNARSDRREPQTSRSDNQYARSDRGDHHTRSENQPSNVRSDNQFSNVRMIRKNYDEVTRYETHFLSPYDDCPLSVVGDSVRFPNFSLGYRPKGEYSTQAPATPKVFVNETRYDVRQAYHRRSNETISSSVHSSQEELATRCKHTQQGISVWQCDCYETGNVWVKQRGERGSSKQKRKKEQVVHSQRCRQGANEAQMPRPSKDPQMPYSQRCRGQTPPNAWLAPNTNSAYSDNENKRSREILTSRSDDNEIDGYHGNDPRMPFKDKIVCSPQGQFGLATPLKDPHIISGSEMAIFEAMAREGITREGIPREGIPREGIPREAIPMQVLSRDGMQTNQFSSPCKEKAGSDLTDDVVAKKPLRSSLKTPSDSLRKFRKKHVTQKVVTSVEKVKDKVKDNVMVTSL